MQEKHVHNGYLFWGSTALVILVMELLGVGWVQRQIDLTIPWPTISTTVGDLAERWAAVYLVVVGVIAAVAFYGLSAPGSNQTTLGRTKRSGTQPTPLRFYNPFTGFALAVLAAGLAIVFFDGEDEKIRRGYVVWGLLAVYAVLLPSLLTLVLRKDAEFPTLFVTFRRLRALHPVVAAVLGAGLVAGLTILVFHLALYPWPNITNAPSRYAGLKADEARSKAIERIRDLGVDTSFAYSTQTRGIDRGGDAWIVYFVTRRGTELEYSNCSVAVTNKKATPTPECSTPTR
jgi:hypothetical protein